MLGRGHIYSVLPGTEWHHCPVCGGCGLLEERNSFTSECPGHDVSAPVLNNVYKGRVNYRKGKWEEVKNAK